jgi:beta-mannosidase
MLTAWQVVRSDPGAFHTPAELSGRWDGGRTMTAGELISAGARGDDCDAFDWWCRATLQVAEPHRIEFAGLTFPATVFVDGEAAAECESMFLPVHVDVAPGHHEVCIRFGSLATWLRGGRGRGRWRPGLAAATALRAARTTLIGRAPVYGALPAPVGAWRPVSVIKHSLAIDLSLRVDAESGTVAVTGVLARPAETRVDVEVIGPDGGAAARAGESVNGTGFQLAVAVPDPQRWYPHGYGPQPLYRARIAIDGVLVHDRPFGFRTVEIDTRAGSFALRVNGVPVFCRGAAWTPPDPVALVVSADVMNAHLRQLVDAGANMVRVVGGLVNEQDEFWHGCAELGIMVWQDAMLATFDPTAEASRLLVREVENLLGAHGGNPALTVVSGGNETVQRPEMLGLRREQFSIEVVDKLLPDLLTRHGDVVYVPSSPSAPPGSDDLAIRPDSGVAHWFGVGGYLEPIMAVRAAGVRFAAECLAFANPPCTDTVDRHFGGAAVAGHHPDWKAGVPRDRGASWDFEDVRDFYVREVFGVDPFAVRRVDPERYLQLGRLAIAEAMSRCYSYWRQPDSGCDGALVLCSKDFVAGAGWGLLDVDGRPKAALHVLSRVWAPVAVIATDGGLSGLRIDVYNDTDERLCGVLTLCASDLRGSPVLTADHRVELTPHSALTFSDSALTGVFRDLTHAFRFGPPAVDGIEVRVEFDSGRTVRDAVVVQPRPGQTAPGLQGHATRQGGGGWALEVVADVALRYVELNLPGWEPSDNYFHLVGGVPYVVDLHAVDGSVAPMGSISSIDAVSAATVQVRP